MATAILLLVAGHETTSNLIGNGIRLLLSDPASAGLDLPAVVEELLRVDSPVMVAVGSANRDETRFERPAEFDVERGARGHVAFGHGLHYCLGAPLARLEGEIALGELVRRFPKARLAVPPAELHPPPCVDHERLGRVAGAVGLIARWPAASARCSPARSIVEHCTRGGGPSWPRHRRTRMSFGSDQGHH